MAKVFKYSDEMVEFIRVNRTMTRAALATAFNTRFGTDKSELALTGKRKSLGLKTGRTGRFEKGASTWNKGLKGQAWNNVLPNNCKSKATQFKPGNVPANVNPIGHERKCSKDGCILVKVAQPNPYTGAKTRYRYKQHIVWEQYNPPIEPGDVIRFYDGNNQNCAIENLFKVSKAVNLRLNKHGFTTLPDELKEVVKTLSVLEVDMYAKMREGVSL